MISKYGTDALRMALIYGGGPGNDVAFDEQKVKGMKHFANKVWNISRFIISNIESSATTDATRLWGRPEPITDADRDILGKLDTIVTEVTEHLDNFRLHEAAQAIYQFTWYELADVYIESSKTQLQDEKTKAITEKMLFHNLITVLKLLHPFMPFITEHITNLMTERGLRKHREPLLISKWPEL
jgi:valyl-tRNA synthetase